MKPEELFAAAIGVSQPWEITSVNLDTEGNRLDIEIDFERGSTFTYRDGKTDYSDLKAYDSSTKSWRHMNFFQYRCYLNARVPRVKLPDGSVKQVKVPWEGISSGFTLLFENFLLLMSHKLPVHQVVELVGSYDSKLWDMLGLYVESAQKSEDLSQVQNIGFDETSVGKGYKYVTTFVCLDTRRTLFVAQGKGKSAVAAFVEHLELHCGDRENIKRVSCDLSTAFISASKECFPNAEFVFDRFHVIKLLNAAIEQTRRAEAKAEPILKGKRFVFLKNERNMTDNQLMQYAEIELENHHLKTFQAMRIREIFQELLKSKDEETFIAGFNKWCEFALDSGIDPVLKAVKTIRKHLDGIVTWFSTKITNAILEGYNSLFKAAAAKARGYRTFQNIKTVILILTGKLDFNKVNYYWATHSGL